MGPVEWFVYPGWLAPLLQALAALTPWLLLGLLGWRLRRRRPRWALGLLVFGVAVGVAGWLVQTLFFNPLAQFLTGVPNPHAFLEWQRWLIPLRLLGAISLALGLLKILSKFVSEERQV